MSDKKISLTEAANLAREQWNLKPPTVPIKFDGDPEGATTCKHCNAPIRETHQGRVRNEWEHMNGLSFCADGKNWAWPVE